MADGDRLDLDWRRLGPAHLAHGTDQFFAQAQLIEPDWFVVLVLRFAVGFSH